MKKLLVFFVMMSLVSVMGLLPGVLGDSQTVGGDVPGYIEFNLLDTSVNYGSVIPGSWSVEKDNRIQVSNNTNLDFSVDITLTSNPQNLFNNLYFDLDDNNNYIESEKLDEVLVYDIIDQAGPFTVTLNSKLRVPAGFGPVIGATGTITYTITGP